MAVELQPSGLGTIGNEQLHGLGPFRDIANQGPGAPIAALSNVISSVIGVITIAAGIFFMLQFLIGGFNWISSAGDKQKLQSAQDRFSHGLIGLIIVVAAYGIMTIISTIIGVPFLNPAAALVNLVIH